MSDPNAYIGDSTRDAAEGAYMSAHAVVSDLLDIIVMVGGSSPELITRLAKVGKVASSGLEQARVVHEDLQRQNPRKLRFKE